MSKYIVYSDPFAIKSVDGYETTLIEFLSSKEDLKSYLKLLKLQERKVKIILKGIEFDGVVKK